ncbi:hypothetical protein I350_00581 [Cryptococcus amylolentus CBS 6273]|uniref:TAFII28-like protein domain-containing protein n=1 Tax=Cryptococcus amylolentus CBS 6273 TaxID=1296118 RepID=A0A1E3KGT6_9TREE|nr:hypothetical protein I350_00581 [Cryptococcus amylolentus CBS 6273]
MSLALPRSSSALSAPRSGNQPLDRQDLDEADDVDDSDLMGVPQPGKRMVDADLDGKGDSDGDDDKDDDYDDRGEAGPAYQHMGGAALGGKGKGKKKDNGQYIEEKAKRKRAETYMLRGQMDEDQGRRFDTFSTVALNKNVIKRLNRDLYDQHCTPQLSQVVAGMAKIFVADVIEMAKELQPHSANPAGPLLPYHLKLAKMCLEQKGMTRSNVQTPANGLRGKKALFRRR